MKVTNLFVHLLVDSYLDGLFFGKVITKLSFLELDITTHLVDFHAKNFFGSITFTLDDLQLISMVANLRKDIIKFIVEVLDSATHTEPTFTCNRPVGHPILGPNGAFVIVYEKTGKII